MTNTLKLSLLLSSAVLLSACNRAYFPAGTAQTPPPAVEVQTTPTPTLSKGNSVESLEADLNATVILDEDFSDIK